MATQFNIPSSPKKQVYLSDTFLGADFTSEASTVDDTKSPNCENIIRSVPGKIRKRMGYEEVMSYEQPILGVHYYSLLDTYLVHAGTSLYNMTGIRGRQWEYISGQVTRPSKEEVQAYYDEQLSYPITVFSSATEDLTSYTLRDKDRHFRYLDTAKNAGPRSPIPTAYEDFNYIKYKITNYYYRPSPNSSSGYWLYYYEYYYQIQEVNDADFVTEAPTRNIFLLDGDVENTLMGEDLNGNRSVSFELGQKLMILDGETLWMVNGTGLYRLSDGPGTDTEFDYSEYAYIPTVTISKDPAGYDSEIGNETKDALNLITAAFIDSFVVTGESATAKVFQMDFAPLDTKTSGGTTYYSPVIVKVMNEDGEFETKTQDVDYTVDYDEGTITFVTAPGQSPIEGEDNVIIQAYRTVEGYADRINHCTIGAMFGINGAHDRIFISGNPGGGQDEAGNHFTYKNCDWWCEQYNPTYWPDLNYSKLGSDTSAIMGYSIINNYLAAHKDYRELTQSVIIREGDLVEDKPTFKIINSLQGAGAVSKYCFSYLATEPVFLTKLGVYAVTAQDVTGEKYAQDRSYYLEGKLLKEPNLEDAFAFSWKDYYIVAVNDHLYILDGLQPMHTDKSRPYATRQYAGFYFTNIPATCFFEMNDELYFGSNSGKIYKFFSDDKAITSYNDNGEPITAVWETADISEKLFYKKKTYRYLALRCMPEISSSVKVYAQKQGIWDMLKDDEQKLKYFTYSQLQYSKLSYSTDKTQKISATKIRLKKLDHVRFKFINDRLNEPLGINDFAVEYTQAGNVK